MEEVFSLLWIVVVEESTDAFEELETILLEISSELSFWISITEVLYVETIVFEHAHNVVVIVNKKIKKVLKDDLKDCVEKDIIKNIKKLFSEVEDEDKLKKIVDDITKFVNGTYQRQLLENIDIKILVKDTTLINGVKEQSERYLFTLENSRLFNEK